MYCAGALAGSRDQRTAHLCAVTVEHGAQSVVVRGGSCGGKVGLPQHHWQLPSKFRRCGHFLLPPSAVELIILRNGGGLREAGSSRVDNALFHSLCKRKRRVPGRSIQSEQRSWQGVGRSLQQAVVAGMARIEIHVRLGLTMLDLLGNSSE